MLKKGESQGISESKPIPLSEVQIDSISRFSSGEDELNIVLGGGIVPGGLYLIGGSPGVGKSTLLLKTSLNLSNDSAQKKWRGIRLSDSPPRRAFGENIQKSFFAKCH